MKGKIKLYNPRCGFGFIVGDDGKYVFVHQTNVTTDVCFNDDNPVEY